MQVQMRAETGREKGSRASRRLRREGRVPATLYGHGIDPIALAVDHGELVAALKGEAGDNVIIALEIDGGETYTTLAREIFKNPVKPFINHVDFLQISLDEVVSAEVGLDFVGEPVGVRLNGGVAETMRLTVNIEALPTAIPSIIEINIEDLDVGDTLHIYDLPVLEGVTYADDPDLAILGVALSAAARTELGLDEVEEGEEGEEVVEGEEAADDAESADSE